MDRRTLIDELFALANGTLASEEAERLRRRCAADPELRAFLESYIEVHAMTECADAEPPPCRLEFAEVEGALASRRAWRVVLHRPLRMVAAVLVLLVGGLVLGRLAANALRGDDGTGRSAGLLALRAVPSVPAEVPLSPLVAAGALASFRPVGAEGVRWIESFEEARAVARLSARPLLLYIFHPTCPYCIEMDRDTFTDAEVRRRLDGFVPTRLDVTKLDDRFKPLLRDGWPWLGAVDADGRTLDAFPGLQGPGDLSARIDEAVRRAGPPVMTWDEVHDLATRFAAAADSETAGRPADAWPRYRALADDGRAGPFADAARDGLARLGQRALAVLLTARELAATPEGLGAARAALDEAIALFAETPLAEDLAAVRARLVADGRFPEIAGVGNP